MLFLRRSSSHLIAWDTQNRFAAWFWLAESVVRNIAARHEQMAVRARGACLAHPVRKRGWCGDLECASCARRPRIAFWRVERIAAPASFAAFRKRARSAFVALDASVVWWRTNVHLATWADKLVCRRIKAQVGRARRISVGRARRGETVGCGVADFAVLARSVVGGVAMTRLELQDWVADLFECADCIFDAIAATRNILALKALFAGTAHAVRVSGGLLGVKLVAVARNPWRALRVRSKRSFA